MTLFTAAVSNRVLLFAIYVVTSVAGLTILRRYLPEVSVSGAMFRSLSLAHFWIMLGGLLYVASFAVWMLVLRTVPLAQAYTTAVSLTICATVLVARFVLNEPISPQQLLGIVIIIAGVFLVLHR